MASTLTLPPSRPSADERRAGSPDRLCLSCLRRPSGRANCRAAGGGTRRDSASQPLPPPAAPALHRGTPSQPGLAVLAPSRRSAVVRAGPRPTLQPHRVLPRPHGGRMASAPVVEVTERVITRLRAEKHRAETWIDAVDLIAEPEPEREWVINDFIERQGRILLAGAEGIGKSFVTLTLAVQAASGKEPVLGRVLTPRIADSEADLVVVDPFYKWTNPNPRDEAELLAALRVIDQWRLHHGVAVILIHHLRKRQSGEAGRGKDVSDMYGSSILSRWPETVMILTEDDRLKVEKDRDHTFADRPAFPLVRGGRWPFSLGDPGAAFSGPILGHLRDAGPTSGNALWGRIGGRTQDFYAAIRNLEREGRIRRSGQRWEAVE